MFSKLLRRMIETADRVRVGFVSEPIALAAADPSHRKVRFFSLEEWLGSDARNGNDDAVAAIDRYADGRHYAVIVPAGSVEVYQVDLGEERARFEKAFYAEDAIRVILNSGIREIKVNPPPPPPPPGHPPPWALVARCDAILRTVRLPVVNTKIDAIADRSFG